MIDVAAQMLPELLITTPGCPDMIAERALSRACRDLCRETHAWRHTTANLPVLEGLREVELDLPTDTSVIRVFWAKLAGESITGVSASNIVTATGTPKGYALSPSGVLMLDKLPSTSYMGDGVELHCSLAPVRGEALLPDELEPFLEVVLEKAKADLYLMPNTEWHDRAAARDAMALYEQSKVEARRHGQQYNQPIHRTVKYGGI